MLPYLLHCTSDMRRQTALIQGAKLTQNGFQVSFFI
jgi:hypothetical protein